MPFLNLYFITGTDDKGLVFVLNAPSDIVVPFPSGSLWKNGVNIYLSDKDTDANYVNILAPTHHFTSIGLHIEDFKFTNTKDVNCVNYPDPVRGESRNNCLFDTCPEM